MPTSINTLQTLQLAACLAALTMIHGSFAPKCKSKFPTVVLGALAPHLPEPLLAEALAIARAIGDDGDRAQALGALVPRLLEAEQAGVLVEALAVARAIGGDWSRARALSALAPHLPEPLLAEALAIAQAI